MRADEKNLKAVAGARSKSQSKILANTGWKLILEFSALEKMQGYLIFGSNRWAALCAVSRLFQTETSNFFGNLGAATNWRWLMDVTRQDFHSLWEQEGLTEWAPEIIPSLARRGGAKKLIFVEYAGEYTSAVMMSHVAAGGTVWLMTSHLLASKRQSEYPTRALSCMAPTQFWPPMMTTPPPTPITLLIKWLL